MKRRRPQPSPHPYVDDPDAPGTCGTCHRADPARSNLNHQMPDAPAQAEHRRRVGESESPE